MISPTSHSSSKALPLREAQQDLACFCSHRGFWENTLGENCKLCGTNKLPPCAAKASGKFVASWKQHFAARRTEVSCQYSPVQEDCQVSKYLQMAVTQVMTLCQSGLSVCTISPMSCKTQRVSQKREGKSICFEKRKKEKKKDVCVNLCDFTHTSCHSLLSKQHSYQSQFSTLKRLNIVILLHIYLHNTNLIG